VGTHAIVHGSVEVEKPALPELEEVGGEPPTKGVRPVHWDDGFTDTDIFQLEEVRAGQVVTGPAVVESAATTFAIPAGRRTRLDRHQIFHLEGDA
jgi:acetone carboxylase beta subunit